MTGIDGVTLDDDIIIDHEELVALGFGQGPAIPNEKLLHQVVLDYLPNEECHAMYENDSQFPLFDAPSDVTDDMICTFTLGKDTCLGDSGGPLVLRRYYYASNNDDIDGSTRSELKSYDLQIGVTSWYVCFARIRNRKRNADG